jgi:GT2 family glycosyltransferase
MSLLSIKKLTYQNYKLIIIDNASTDGSFEQIISYLNIIGLKAKIIKNKRNLGFTGGNNIGYLNRDPRSKYVVLLNNDAIVYPDSLTKMVQAMESDPKCGALQGIILWLDKNSIQNAGFGIDEFMFSNEIKRIKYNKDYYVSFSSGCYSIYRIEALKKIGDVPFIWSMFLYFDDNILGAQLWNIGYTVKCIPYITARHLGRRSSKLSSSKWTYYHWIKGWIASLIISNSKLKKSLPAYPIILIRLLIKYLLTNIHHGLKPFILGLRDGIAAGHYMKRKGLTLDIYKIPLIKRNVSIIRITPLYFILRKIISNIHILTPKTLCFYEQFIKYS